MDHLRRDRRRVGVGGGVPVQKRPVPHLRALPAAQKMPPGARQTGRLSPHKPHRRPGINCTGAAILSDYSVHTSSVNVPSSRSASVCASMKNESPVRTGAPFSVPLPSIATATA